MNGATADSKSVAAPAINNAFERETAVAGSTNAFPTAPESPPPGGFTSQVDLPVAGLRHRGNGKPDITVRPALHGAS
jgi:hypothetical protein